MGCQSQATGYGIQMITEKHAITKHSSKAFFRQCVRGLGFTAYMLVGGTVGLIGQESDSISKIEVLGAQKITKENLLFRLGIRDAADVRGMDFSALVEKIWAIGVYDDIKIKVDEKEDGNVLVIEVKERPIIKEIDYRGGTLVGVTNIKDKIKESKLEIALETVYNPETARKIKSRIVDLASEKGFTDPLVAVVLEPLGPGTCRLVFDINEGSKARIYKIKFQGNSVYSDRKLKGFGGITKKTREHWMFSWMTSHDLLVDKNLEEDKQNIKNAYLMLGYKDIFVGHPTVEIMDHTTKRQKAKNIKREARSKAPKVDLRSTMTFHLLEGERFFEGKLALEGNQKVYALKGEQGERAFRRKMGEARRDNRSKLAKFFNFKPRTEDLPPGVNEPMDFLALNKGIEEIEKIYKNLAFAQANISPRYETRVENGISKVDTTLVVSEGEKYYVRRIDFQGNDTTLDKVLRRAILPLSEGAPFSIELLQNGILGLNQLGFFEVKPPFFPEIKAVEDKPLVDIVIIGEEAGVNEFMLSSGYGAVFGFTLGASVSTKNLGGGGETLGISFNVGQFQKSYSVSFSEPYVMDKPFSFGISFSDTTYDYSASQVGSDYAFKQRSRGIGLSTGTRLSTFMPSDKWGIWTSFSQLGIGYNLQSIEMEGGQNYFFRTSGSVLTSMVNLNCVFSTVNHPFKPTDGYKLGAGFGYGGWQFGTDKPYHRTTAEATYFKSYGQRHIFGFNASYGYIANLSGEELPIWNNFRPGGEMSIRGYRYGWVGTQKLDNMGRPVVVGGNKEFLANAEYQIVIAEQFRMLFFFDMGNAWAPGRKFFSEPLRRSVGLEFRFFLPISPAPMRLIWAYKLNPYDFDTLGRTDFQFSIGTTF
jgi:outer membrane protein insertion porin family